MRMLVSINKIEIVLQIHVLSPLQIRHADSIPETNGPLLRKRICAVGLKGQSPTLQHLLRYAIAAHAIGLLKHPIHQRVPSEVSRRNVRSAHESMRSH